MSTDADPPQVTREYHRAFYAEPGSSEDGMDALSRLNKLDAVGASWRQVPSATVAANNEGKPPVCVHCGYTRSQNHDNLGRCMGLLFMAGPLADDLYFGAPGGTSVAMHADNLRRIAKNHTRERSKPWRALTDAAAAMSKLGPGLSGKQPLFAPQEWGIGLSGVETEALATAVAQALYGSTQWVEGRVSFLIRAAGELAKRAMVDREPPGL